MSRRKQASRSLWLRVKPWGAEEERCLVGEGMCFTGAGEGCEGSEESCMRLSAALAESGLSQLNLSVSSLTLGAIVFRPVSKHVVLMWLVLESPSPRMKFEQNLSFLREVSGFIHMHTFETRD